MSYASDVKKELTAVKSEPCCLRAELQQIIRLQSTLSINNRNFIITLTTTSLAISRRIITLFKTIYDVNIEMLKKERDYLDKKPLYYLVIREKGLDILRDLDLIDENYFIKTDFSNNKFTKDCCESSMLRAAFLVRGSINDPNTNNYHLEIITNKESEAVYLQMLLEKRNITSKIIERKKGFVLYIKKSENIADFLGYIGASNSLFAFEDLRIKKDLSNYVNRIINCDVANEQKAMASALKQIENIKWIEKNYGFMNLSPRLMDAVILRTTYPEDSLNQLSEKSEETIGRYISKSGLSHCFRDLEELVKK